MCMRETCVRAYRTSCSTHLLRICVNLAECAIRVAWACGALAIIPLGLVREGRDEGGDTKVGVVGGTQRAREGPLVGYGCSSVTVTTNSHEKESEPGRY